LKQSFKAMAKNPKNIQNNKSFIKTIVDVGEPQDILSARQENKNQIKLWHLT